MLCIELSRNGKRLATGGLPGKGVLSVIFDRVFAEVHGPRELLHFSFGGLDTSAQPNASLTWAYGGVLVGDEFTVRFVEATASDEPHDRAPPMPRSTTDERRARLKHLRIIEREAKLLRKELGLAAPRERLTRRAARGRSPR
jgi:hypothetical protein